MFAIQLVDVEARGDGYPRGGEAWRSPSFTDVLRADGTDVVDGWSWCGQPGVR